MPCYHPLEAFYDSVLKKVYFSSIPKLALLTHLDAIQKIKLPCGKCIGCRLERSRKWAMRCVYEAQQYQENSFLTLTYAPEFLPEGGTLVKRDLQLFFKRLRKSFPDVKIRYFACGEYGEQFARPHYHVILFGFCPPDYKRKKSCAPAFGKSQLSLSSWVSSAFSSASLEAFFANKPIESDESNLLVRYSPIIEKIWGLGHVAVGEVTFESCAYVARYCLKKVNGAKAKEYYGERLPEFVVMSRRPGIAANFFDKWKDDIFPRDQCFARGVPCKPPRYFDKLLEKINPDELAQIKALRKIFAEANEVPFERLLAAEEIALDGMKKISRKFEKNP